MKRHNHFIAVATIVSILIILTGCKKDPDNPKIPSNSTDEIELITTMILRFSDINGTVEPTEAIFRDPDGEGGNAPTQFDEINLRAYTAYNCEILLLDESKNPADTVSQQIALEAVDHLFCFDAGGLNIGIIRTDTDGLYELGLNSLWTTDAPQNGTVTITLKHQPGIKNGSCDPGDTDIELTFEVSVEP